MKPSYHPQRIAVSIGDPSGIGPEIILKALRREHPDRTFLVFGPRELFEAQARQMGLELPAEGVEWIWRTDAAPGPVTPGQSDALAGAMQVASLEAALQAVLSGRADALCTAPITKAAARDAGFPFPGHTEYLAHGCGVSRSVMMLTGPTLRVVPLTGHVPLREVPDRIDPGGVAEVMALVVRALAADFGVDHPRVVLAGLNPHAGEQGMLGQEEDTLLRPGLVQARAALDRQQQPATLEGPLPADAIFVAPGRWDAVICCYHDQALIPLKLLHRDDGVNITLGLPIVRTSPAHGSALDIAGQGVAREQSMLAALDLAAQVARRRLRQERESGSTLRIS